MMVWENVETPGMGDCPGQKVEAPRNPTLIVGPAVPAASMVPERIVFADALPRNALGKVQRAQLRARFEG